MCGNLAENGGYLGPPLILLFLLAVWLGRRDGVVRVAAVMAVVAVILSFGGHLRVAGHLTRIPLPWDLVQNVTVLKALLPSRFSCFALLFITLAIVRGVPRVPSSGQFRIGLGILVAASMVFLWPHRPVSEVGVNTPEFFTTGLITRIPPSSLVVVTPEPNSTHPVAMLWQSMSHMRFRTISGYAVPFNDDNPPPDAVSVALNDLQAGSPVPPSVTDTDIRDDLIELRASAIVLGPGTNQIAATKALFTRVRAKPRRGSAAYGSGRSRRPSSRYPAVTLHSSAVYLAGRR